MSEYEYNPGSDEAIEEEFRDIEGFEGKYQISNLGRVKSLQYYGVEGKEGFLTPRWVTTERNNGEYALVRLIDSKQNKDKQYLIHRLVAKAFIPNPEKKKEVNHIDGNTKNNKAENLEWATRSENQKHAVENDLADNPPSTKDTGKEYAWENKNGEVFYGTPAQLARKYTELDEAYLYKIVNEDYEHYKSHKGWKQIEIPAPGSDRAIDMGGGCPVLDNAHGRGYKGIEGEFITNLNCPLHGVQS